MFTTKEIDMFGTCTTRKSESQHSATRWTVLLTVALVAFSSPALAHKKGKFKNLLPPSIETPVEASIALGPHPSDPAYGQYKKKYKEEVVRRKRKR